MRRKFSPWLLWVLAILVQHGSLSHAEIIVMQDGSEFEDRVVSYDDGYLLLEQRGRISRADVKAIRFVVDEPVAAVSEHAVVEVSEDIRELLTLAEEATLRFPTADGIILVDDGEHILRADGTRFYRYHFVGRVMSHAKKEEWASRRMTFDEDRTRPEVVMARSISPDGKVFNLDKSTIRVGDLPEEGAHFGRHKIMTFVIPGVEIGSLVEYVVTYETFSPVDKERFEPGFAFQATEPVVRSSYRVTIPANKELQYITRNMPEGTAEPEITRTEDTITYYWKVENQEPIVEEPYGPELGDIVALVEGTTLKDWDHLYEWDSRFTTRRMQVTPEIEDLVNSLTRDITDVERKIAVLYHWIQENIKYISIKGSVSSGMAGHPAQQTLDNKYGDCIDKSVLFCTMLKVIGVDAYPVSVVTNDEMEAIRDIPILMCNHAITEIHLGDRVFYLDPTNTDYRYPYFSDINHGITCVNSILKRINFIPVPPPEDNMNAYRQHIRIEPEGRTTVRMEGEYTGNYEQRLRYFWRRRVREDERPKRFQQYVNSISPGGILEDFELKNLDNLDLPFRLSYSYVLPSYPVFAGDLMIFGIPGFEYEFEEIALDERKYDIEYETSRQTKHEIMIEIPDGYRVKYIPQSLKLRCRDYATYEAKFTVEDGVIILRDDFRRPARIIRAEHYREYKEFLQRVSRFSKEQIFFVRESSGE